jgi:hypothetical protein
MNSKVFPIFGRAVQCMPDSLAYFLVLNLFVPPFLLSSFFSISFSLFIFLLYSVYIPSVFSIFFLYLVLQYFQVFLSLLKFLSMSLPSYFHPKIYLPFFFLSSLFISSLIYNLSFSTSLLLAFLIPNFLTFFNHLYIFSFVAS